MKPITIIGGGLAGLTLGIALRREGVPVTIHEAGDYPRRRVCGEFISGRGLQTLKRFDLWDGVIAAGARRAQTTAFYLRGRQMLRCRLPADALCISRHCLDAFLAREFPREGGDLHVRSRWTKPMEQEGVVRATGRRPQPQIEGARWHGLKAHATRVELAADLEMHFDAEAYVGLCRLDGERVNVCGFFRTNIPEQLGGAEGSELNHRLAAARWDEDSRCSVAGLSPYPQLASDVAIGDALSMPAPVTGNGMSMAFESAELATGPLLQYSGGLVDWESATSEMQRQRRRAFASRLRWSHFLHWALFRQKSRGLTILVPMCWRALFHATR